MENERAIEILDPEHREAYESLEPVNEACRMGVEALRRRVPESPYPDGEQVYWPARSAGAANTCTTRTGTAAASAGNADRRLTGTAMPGRKRNEYCFLWRRDKQHRHDYRDVSAQNPY